MISFIVRLLVLFQRALNKIRYILNPGLRPLATFPKELRKILKEDLLQVVDVGGAVDLQPHWYKLIEAARFIIFEPHPASYESLVKKYEPYVRRQLFQILPVGLSGTGGMRTLSMTNTPTGSSIVRFNDKSPFFHPDDGYLFPLQKIPIETQTLDQSLNQGSIGAVDLIKLDIQGAELEVLNGFGSKRLAELLAVEMEVHLHDFYLDGSKLQDVVRFIDENDFELLDVRVARDYIQRFGLAESLKKYLEITHWAPSTAAKAWEFDMVFFRKPTRLLEARNGDSIRKLIACYCVYNFFLEACGLAMEAHRAGIFSSTDKDEIYRSVLAMKKSMDRSLSPYAKVMKGLDDQNWGQYMWVRFPTT